MREDLNKLLCERQRFGSTNSYHTVRNSKRFNENCGDELENLPVREGMKNRYGWHWDELKELNENLNPLYGLVRKNARRPWDKVYSELCSVFNMKSVINRHILEHLFQMVELKTFMDDGVIMHRGWRRGATPVLTEDGPEYFVHPTTGILLKNEHYKSYRQRNNKSKKEWRSGPKDTPLRKIISETIELRKHVEDGPWFVCELEKFESQYIFVKRPVMRGDKIEYVEERKEITKFDMWMKRTVNYYGTCVYRFIDRNKKKDDEVAKTGYFVKSIKTASHKELKQYGLK